MREGHIVKRDQKCPDCGENHLIVWSEGFQECTYCGYTKPCAKCGGKHLPDNPCNR